MKKLFIALMLLFLCAGSSQAFDVPWDMGTNYCKLIKKSTAPTSADVSYQIGTVWIDTTNDVSYQLTDITAGAATWQYAGVASASLTVPGVVELSTNAETVTGTATNVVTTPANITAKMAAPGTIGGTTPAAGNFTNITANATYAAAKPATWTASTFTTGGSALPTTSTAGWWFDATGNGGLGSIKHVTGATTTLISTDITTAIVPSVAYSVVIAGTGGAATCSYVLGGVMGTTLPASGALGIADFITPTTATSNVSFVITPGNTSTIEITSIVVKAMVDATGDQTANGNLIARSQILGSGLTGPSNPTHSFENDPDTGIYRTGSNAFSFAVGGTRTFGFDSNSFSLLRDDAYWRMGAALDTTFYRDAAYTIGFRSATNQTKTNFYNTAASATSNYERLAITGVQGASLNLTAETNGTGGANLDIVLTPAGTGQTKTTLSDNNGGHAITINANQAGVTASDTFMDFRSTTGSEGTIAGTAVAGVLAYNTFTGSHYTKIVNKPQDIPIGTVLEMTGNLIGEWPDKSYIETIDVVKIVPFIVKSIDEEGGIVEKPLLDEKGNPETYITTEKKDILHDLRVAPKQYLAESRICATKGSKAVYGVYGGTDKEGRDMVLALGTGVILVVNTGVNINVGDFLISSAKKGCAELQEDGFYRNSTIAKVAQNVVWKAGEISRLVACIYLGG